MVSFSSSRTQLQGPASVPTLEGQEQATSYAPADQGVVAPEEWDTHAPVPEVPEHRLLLSQELVGCLHEVPKLHPPAPVPDWICIRSL